MTERSRGNRTQENTGNGDVDNARKRRRKRQSANLKLGEPNKIAQNPIEIQGELDIKTTGQQESEIEKKSNGDVDNTGNPRGKGISLNAPNLAANNPMGETLVANQHTADIVLPRSYPRQKGEIHGKPLESMKFLSGTVTSVDFETWELMKQKNTMVPRYLELGFLVETKSTRDTGALIERTANPQPPEHLLSDKEGKTRIERETVSQAQL